MPVISKIVRQKKNKDRYAIFLDEKYAFGVTEKILIDFGLTKSKSLSQSEIMQITEQDHYSRTYSKALNYLSYRMRTIQEMETYLQKQEAPSEWIEKMIVKLLEENFLDDQLFADAYVRDRMNQTTKGPILIRKELREKNIEEKMIKHALEQYSVHKQMEQATKWLLKARKKKGKHAHRKHEDQLKMKMMQRGFNQAIIQDVFMENPLRFDEAGEVDILQKQADKLFHKHRKKLAGFELEMKLKALLFQRGFQAEMIEDYIQKIKETNKE